MSIRQTETSSVTWIHLKSFAVLLAFSKDKDKKHTTKDRFGVQTESSE